MGSSFVEYSSEGLKLTFNAGMTTDREYLWERYTLSGKLNGNRQIKFMGNLKVTSSRRGRIFEETGMIKSVTEGDTEVFFVQEKPLESSFFSVTS